MAVTEQLEVFNAFARRLEQERGEAISLDEAMQAWQEIDHAEIEVLRERYASFLAGEHGRSVDEFLAERRVAREKQGS